MIGRVRWAISAGTPMAHSARKASAIPELAPPGQNPSTAATPMSTANIAARTRSSRRRILTGGPS